MNVKRCMLAAALGGALPHGVAQTHPFSIKDSIEMARFSEPSGRSRESVPITSPDGRYFVVVTSRGLLASDEMESDLWLFKTQSVKQFVREDDHAIPPPPTLLASSSAVPLRPASDAYQATIWDLRWSPTSKAIYYLRQGPAGERQLWRVEIAGAHRDRLSPPRSDVERFSLAGDVVAFYAGETAVTSHPEPDRTSPPSAKWVRGVPLYNILFPTLNGSLLPEVHRLWVARHGEARERARTSPQLDLDHYWDVLSLSPDGRHAIQILPVANIPAAWESYATVPGREDWKLDHNDPKLTSPSYLWRARQYVVIDLTSGASHPLIDAPYGDVLAHLEATQAVWSSHGATVLLTNTFLPLDRQAAGEHTPRSQMCAVAEVQVPSGSAQCIVFTRDASATNADPNPLELEQVSFGADENEVVAHFVWPQEKRGQTESYRKVDGAWTLVGTIDDANSDTHPPASQEMTVQVKQSLNEPPVLWATDRQTGRARQIWNPNPQLDHSELGVASILHWRDRTGYEWTGGLVKPVGFVPGKRYPLVIQTHGFLDFEFLTDGQYPSGMVARPLASAGFFVLQMRTNYTHLGSAAEATDNVLGYESAIAQLASDGLIDPRSVGIVGFSRTSWYVETALVTQPKLFAAVSINDGTDQSYMQEMLFQLDRTSEAQQMYHAAPYGVGLSQWIQMAPSFHLDQVSTPVMLTAIGSPSILEEWEIYSSLYRQEKPVDLIYIPGGQHILQRPQERRASQQNTVDWFGFWLQGYERPAPDDPDQYKRWRHLRELRDIAGKTAEVKSAGR